MNTAIGHTFLYNLIIIFILVVFGCMTGTLSYYKAYKINNRIVSLIEKHEGYNELAKEEIDDALQTLGYTQGSIQCDEQYKGNYFVTLGENYNYCVYITEEKPKKHTYFNYGVLTYMTIDLPIINNLRFPVFTRTNKIYKFTTAQQSS